MGNKDPRFYTRWHNFDAYKGDKEKRAAEYAAWFKQQRNRWDYSNTKEAKIKHAVHVSYTVRSRKVPITLAKIGEPKDEKK